MKPDLNRIERYAGYFPLLMSSLMSYCLFVLIQYGVCMKRILNIMYCTLSPSFVPVYHTVWPL